jgi:dolichol-phosphate mannosyltransferase
MDCDGTHNPKYIPNLIEKSKFFDLIITSRFKRKNSLKDWPAYRKFLTTLRLNITKLFLNLNYDTSGAFRCFKRNKIKLIDILSVKSNNYDFFLESIYHLIKKNYSIYEVPTNLPFRKLGKSKMNFLHIIQYLFKLILIRFNF